MFELLKKHYWKSDEKHNSEQLDISGGKQMSNYKDNNNSHSNLFQPIFDILKNIDVHIIPIRKALFLCTTPTLTSYKRQEGKRKHL